MKSNVLAAGWTLGRSCYDQGTLCYPNCRGGCSRVWHLLVQSPRVYDSVLHLLLHHTGELTMAHIYTIATTIRVEVESNQPLTDSQLREIMNEADYSVSGEGEADFDFYTIPYRVSDTEMEDWQLVAEREA